MKTLIVMMAATFLTTGALAAAPKDDAEIVHIVHTANVGEITAGELAQSKASAADVKSFASDMVKEHQAMDKDGNELAQKLKLTPKDNPTSKTLKADADKETAKLKTMTGKDFDTAYVNSQVKMHETVLTSLEKDLIPNAKNAELKTMLQDAQKKVQMHLDHAKTLQKDLKAAH